MGLMSGDMGLMSGDTALRSDDKALMSGDMALMSGDIGRMSADMGLVSGDICLSALAFCRFLDYKIDTATACELNKGEKNMKKRDLRRLSPRNLIAELRTYVDGLGGSEATYGMTAADTPAATTKIDSTEAALDSLDIKRAEVAAGRGTRDNEMDALIDLVGHQFDTARLEVGNDAGKLAAINLDAYDTTPTTPDAPDSAPFARIDVGILRHTLTVRDSANPDKRGRPEGMRGYEVWSKVGGDAAETEADYSMVAFNTKPEHIINYQIADKGKQAWYRLRWVTTSGEPGPWGPTAEATVSG